MIIIKIGDRWGRLVAIKEDVRINRYRRILCQCDCGNICSIMLNNLQRGNTQSCGCLRDEKSKTRAYQGILSRRNKTHGMSKTAEYNTWAGMKQRCTNPKFPYFNNYGGRGISECPEWAKSFPVFLSDMGMKPSPDLSIDRIDNDGNYEPKNCRWATRQQQEKNKRIKIKAL